MTVGQALFDVMVWLRRYGVSETIGRPELKVLFYEVFQETWSLAMSLNPEWFLKTASCSGTSYTLPADFFRVAIILVDSHTVGNSGCTSGAVRIVDNDKWDSMQNNPRLVGTAADPIGRVDKTVITIYPGITAGTVFYYRNYKESDLSTDSTELSTLLPTPYHQHLILRLTEKARLRQKQIPDAATNSREKVMQLARFSHNQLKKSIKQVRTVEDQVERPLTLMG